MKVEMLNVTDLREYPQNPRTIPQSAVDAVAKSIEAFGFRNPVLVDKDGVIVAGHTRIRAAKQLGLTSVPCIRIEDLTPEQVKAYRIADNQTGTLTSFDDGLLMQELSGLVADDFDLSALGFNANELRKLLEEVVSPEDFPEKGDDLETDYQCPKCGYRWSGKHGTAK